MKKITLFLMSLMVSTAIWAQCTTAGAGQWPSGQVTVDNSGAIQTYNTFLYTDEFSDVTGYNIGDDYEFVVTRNSDGAHKYITLVDGSGTAVASGLSPLTFTATDVDLDIYRHDDDGSGGCLGESVGHTGTIQNLTSSPPPPPANDDCASATVLTGPSTTAFDTTAATADGPTAFCGTTPGGPNVWFVYTTSGTGDLNVSVCNDADYDTKINVYSGSCGALVCEGGNDDGTGCGLTSDLTLAALPAGTYYIAISGFSGATGTGNFTLNFTLSDGPDLENPTAFTYYPNPVNNKLTLNAQNNIENVRMYNMLGQEVMRVQPQTVDSELDMSSLETGTYFVQVTIANVTKTVRVVKQ